MIWLLNLYKFLLVFTNSQFFFLVYLKQTFCLAHNQLIIAILAMRKLQHRLDDKKPPLNITVPVPLQRVMCVT